MSSLLMEALQMRKFQLKQNRLNFTEGWITPEKMMLEDAPDKDLLEELLMATPQSVDNAIQSISRAQD